MFTALMTVNLVLTLLWISTIVPVWLRPERFRAEAGHIQGLLFVAVGMVALLSWAAVTAVFWFRHFA